LSKARTIAASSTAFQAPTSAAAPNVAKGPAAAPAEPPAPPVANQVDDVPDAIVLTRDFGFRLNGCVRTWPAGQLITKHADVVELLANGAPARRFREIA
jgi:hypothetical protein